MAKYTVPELAKVFAQRSVTAGSSGSVSFVDKSFYSYGVKIAEIVSEHSARVTTHKYSVTTSKHTGQALRALIDTGYNITRGDF